MKHNYFIVFLIMLIFIVISFVTNIIDPMGSDVKTSFGLTQEQTGYLATALFLAYAVMSIPSGMLVERFSPKSVLVAAFFLSTAGAVAFASKPAFGTALPSLFIIGVGFAMLQVVINPLLRVAGGEEHYAFFGNMTQMIFALGSTVSPHLYAYLVNGLKDQSTSRNLLFHTLGQMVPAELPWVSLYWVFTVMLLLMAVIIIFLKIPKMELKEDEKVGSIASILELLKSRTVWFYFIGIICYVGTEQGVAVWIREFLQKYHHVDPDLVVKLAVAGFWGAMVLGCAVGLILLKLFDARKVLATFAACGVITLLVGLFGPRQAAMIALPMMGFWCSVGWPVVFSLALNSLEKHHGSFAGILCTGILGGAVFPPLIGRLGDVFGLRTGMLVIVVTLGYLICIGLYARPLVQNATIMKKKAAET